MLLLAIAKYEVDTKVVSVGPFVAEAMVDFRPLCQSSMARCRRLGILREEQEVVQPNKEIEEGLFYRFKVSKITYLIDGGQGKKSLPTCCPMRKSRDYNTSCHKCQQEVILP